MKRIFTTILFIAAFTSLNAQNVIMTLSGQTGDFTSAASTTVPTFGTGANTGEGGLASAARLNTLESIAVYGGSLYLTDRGSNTLKKIDLSTNIITTVLSGLSGPRSIVFEENGRFFLSEGYKITLYNNDGTNPVVVAGPTGVVPSPLTSNEVGFINGLPGTSRLGNSSGQINSGSARGMAYDKTNKVLYIADLNNNAIRKLDCNAGPNQYYLSTFANTSGNGSSSAPGNTLDPNSAANTTFRQPSCVALDKDNNVYWGTLLSYNIYKSNSAGNAVSQITNGVFNNANTGDDGLVSAARVGQISAMAFDENNDLYISDVSYHRIRKIVLGGNITAYAGKTNFIMTTSSPAVTGTDFGSGGDGLAPVTSGTSNIHNPQGIAFGSYNGGSNILFLAEAGARRIRMVGPQSVLPLNLTSFTASNANNSASLKWNTANEVNVKEFIVEKRSGIETDFTAIGNVPAKNIVSASYSFSDVNITSSDNYYRLKMVDNDGSSKYSDIEHVKFSILNGVSLSVAPNPVVNTIKVMHEVAGANASVTVYSLDGKLITNVQVSKDSTQTSLDASYLATGQYVLEFRNNGSKKSISFLK